MRRRSLQRIYGSPFFLAGDHAEVTRGKVNHYSRRPYFGRAEQWTPYNTPGLTGSVFCRRGMKADWEIL